MTSLYHRALDDLARVFSRLDETAVDRAVEAIASAERIALYGVGREGLQIKGFAMRLFHLGRQAAMVGDMTTPPVGPGDLLIVSAGPGEFSTVLALMGVAKDAGAKTLVVTAQPDGEAAKRADFVLTVPAQTMADDTGPATSVLPMGSLYEGRPVHSLRGDDPEAARPSRRHAGRDARQPHEPRMSVPSPTQSKAGRLNPGYGRWTPALFLAPAVLALLVIGIYPTIFALVTSFRRYNITRPRDGFPFIGIENYQKVLSDQTFWDTLGLTFRFFLTVMPFQIFLGIVIALLLHKPGLGLLRTLSRVSLVVPLATTYAVVGLIGRLVFNGNFGVANQMLGWFGIPGFDWLATTNGAFAAIAIMDIWQWTPFCALIFLAGLSMVPVEVEEAARLETSSKVALLRYVQLPYLLPGLTAVLILRSADVLKLFDMIFTMTRGGPGTATELISIYIQRVGFRVFDMGTASAQAILLLILTIMLSRLYIRVFYREIQ